MEGKTEAVHDLTMLKKADACEYYGISYATLTAMEAEGLIAGITVGGRRYYPPYLTRKALDRAYEREEEAR